MKRVFVLSRHSMFSEGIEMLLSHQTEIEIILWENDSRTAEEWVHLAHPDVVIVDCDDPDPELTPALCCILRERMGICLIAMSLRDNEICIHRGEQKQVRHLQDLLEVIHG